MKAIILAAGRGTRIPSITKKKPKCLIKVNKIPILLRQINFLRKLNIKDIIIVKGFKKNQINYKNIKYVINKNYKKNEQLESLFCAKKEMKCDLIITFADTIYDFSLLKKIVEFKKGEIILGIDKKWKKRYKFRYDHPFIQADKVRINKQGNLLKIGKGLSLKETNAEFLGILKLTKKGCSIFSKSFKKLKKKEHTNRMQIHNFIQILIQEKEKIFSCDLQGKFMEIDTFNDYKIASKMFTT